MGLYAKFQRSGLKRSRVISERSLVSTGSFAEKNTDCLLRKSLCCLRVQFPKEYDVERSVNSALVYVKDETILDLLMDEIKLLSLLKTSSFAINSVVTI